MPNHRIYKPSVYQKSLEVGTREKSQRSRKKTERYENTLKPNPEALKRLTRWTAKELAILNDKLQLHGSSNLEDLLDPQLNKNEDQIKEILNHFKKGNRTNQIPDPRGRKKPAPKKDKEDILRQNDCPIEDWINLAESVTTSSIKATVRDLSLASDWSHLVQDSLSVIINEEKHPNPEDCDGIDYKEIYKYIHDIMIGEVPKDVNEATAQKILEMMSELRENGLIAKGLMKDEMSTLERYTSRDILALNLKFQKQTPEEGMKNLCDLGKVNPLRISSTFYTKKSILKE